MVWLPIKFPQICFGGETPNYQKKKKSTPHPRPLIFQSMCILCENSVHMFLSLLYSEVFPREYLTSPDPGASPHLPCLLHYPISPNTLGAGTHVPVKADLGGVAWAIPQMLDGS